MNKTKLLQGIKLSVVLGGVYWMAKMLSPFVIKQDPRIEERLQVYPQLRTYVRIVELLLELEETLETMTKQHHLIIKLYETFAALSGIEAAVRYDSNYKAQACEHRIDNLIKFLEHYPYPIYSMRMEVEEVATELREFASDMCHNINQDCISNLEY
uniref:Uncharacterized protein n=1 Tax=viral metagenome TaxID=1070528 RepID=A0A6C0BPZ1_9ZZZZ